MEPKPAKDSLLSRLREFAEPFSLRDPAQIRDLLTRPDTHPGVQFLKYGAAGVFATAVHLVVFYLLSILVLPAIDPAMGNEVRAWRATINNTAAFLVSNAFGYLINARWIFVAGRHPRWREVLLFFAVSGISYFLGTWTMLFLIREFGVNTHLAQVAYIFSAVLVNFVCRKFLIFRG